jgi:rhamnose transport system ATP-binding protein
MAPLLECVSIAKSFAGVRALSGVSLEVSAGEVHALVGENGAGKSTLIRIITGAEQPDSGRLTLDGHSVASFDPSTARAFGIAAIYQQPSLFPDLTVAENIAFALERGGPWRRIDWKERLHRATALLDRVGASIDPSRLAGTLRPPEQQLVEIAKAIGAEAQIVLMDEPTASLTDAEVLRLMTVIKTLRDAGTGVIYISHRLEEVFAIADRVTVLRDGETVGTHRLADVSARQLIEMMVGRELTQLFPKRPVPLGDVALELVGLSNRVAGVRNVSLQVRHGEIVGLAGLVGCGRSELAETLFGLSPADAGDVLVSGQRVNIGSPSDAIRHGIGYVPKDRRQHGVIPEMSVAKNISIASLAAVSANGLVQPAREFAAAGEYINKLRIKTPSASTEVEDLSGGNQQKVALARWLMTGARVLLLDEPTQGVDVGAKAEIHALIGDLVEQGTAVLLISSELPELLGMCDRIAVMRAGTIAGILPPTATAAQVMALALGHQ